jgi:hypothetical protein
MTKRAVFTIDARANNHAAVPVDGRRRQRSFAAEEVAVGTDAGSTGRICRRWSSAVPRFGRNRIHLSSDWCRLYGPVD